jgi:Xaa-Pro aminopeptidase
MASADERACNPVSTGELERRWAVVRAQMPAAGIDALVIQGANNLVGTGGYFRWLTGISSAQTSKPQTVIFPREGLMTLVCHGRFNEDTKLDGTDPALPGIGRRFGTPSFAAVNYTDGYDAEIVAREIKKGGFRSVGFVGANTMYFGFGARLKELLAGVRLIDATDVVDPLKAVKSPEEIAFIRRTAAMQDEVMVKVREHVRPGMRDFEVMAYGQYVSQLLGSETGYLLGSSAALGAPTRLRRRPEQGRKIRRGDILMFQLENTGPGGLFVHLARIFVFGKVPQEIGDAFGQMVEAQDYTVALLKPGMPCRDVFRDYNSYMRGRGLPEENRLHCHGQGYDFVERPLIRSDETMTLAANINIGIHPSIANQRMFVTVCDNFLIGVDGTVERLHKTPRTIIEV